jgi:hypothetical protein
MLVRPRVAPAFDLKNYINDGKQGCKRRRKVGPLKLSNIEQNLIPSRPIMGYRIVGRERRANLLE